MASTDALLFAENQARSLQKDVENMLRFRNRISLANISFKFNCFSKRYFIYLFGFEKDEIPRVKEAIVWPYSLTETKRNRYAPDPFVVSSIILRRLKNPLDEVILKLYSAITLLSYLSSFGKAWSCFWQ